MKRGDVVTICRFGRCAVWPASESANRHNVPFPIPVLLVHQPLQLAYGSFCSELLRPEVTAGDERRRSGLVTRERGRGVREAGEIVRGAPVGGVICHLDQCRLPRCDHRHTSRQRRQDG